MQKENVKKFSSFFKKDNFIKVPIKPQQKDEKFTCIRGLHRESSQAVWLLIA